MIGPQRASDRGPSARAHPSEETSAAWVDALFDVAGKIPSTSEPVHAVPDERAVAITRAAAIKAALVSGAFSLPPGPLGLLTILPDLITVWRIQAQMVADIGGAFGKTAVLGEKQMMHCLFRHATAQVLRDWGLRASERLIFHPRTLGAVSKWGSKVGLHLSRRALERSALRFLPLVGSASVAGYAYFDTLEVGRVAAELFRHDGVVEGSGDEAS